LASDQLSGIDHFEVKIDEGDYSVQASPYLLTQLTDGQHVVYVRAYDMAGNYKECTTDVYIDTTKPNEFSPISNPSTWTSDDQPEIIFYTTDDISGIDYYDVNIDGSNFTTQDSPYELPPQTDGTHLVIIRAYDMAGNYQEGLVEVYIDTTAPNDFFPSADPSGWTSDDRPLITFYATDNLSGIDYYEIDVDNSGFSIQESPYELPAQTDGSHTITVRAFDLAGNYRDSKVTIYIDTLQPHEFSPIVDPANWTSNDQPEISFYTTDVTSGIDHYDIKVDDGEFLTVESPYILTEQTDGIHIVTIRAYDLAGNYRDGTVKVYIDTTPPNEFKPTVDAGYWVSNNDPEILFNTTDDTSGIDHYEVKIDDDEFMNQTSPYRLPTQNDGVHILTVRAYDMAGNYRDAILNLRIDTEPPKITHKGIAKGNEKKEISISADITDKYSGVGNVTLYYKLKKSDSYSTLVMNLVGNNYTAIISANKVTSDVEYYIEASDRSNPSNNIYFGAEGPTNIRPNSDTDIDISIKSKDQDTNLYLLILAIIIIIIIVGIVILILIKRKKQPPEEDEVQAAPTLADQSGVPQVQPVPPIDNA
jgi:hypothetical protein